MKSAKMKQTGVRTHIIMLLAILTAEFIVLALLQPNVYLSGQNLVSMAFQMAPIGLLGLAIGITMLIGGIDLSIISVSNIGGITSAFLMTQLAGPLGDTGAIAVAVAAGLLVGALAGLINGLLFAYLNVSPIIITLGTMLLFAGLATGVTNASTQYGIDSFTVLGRTLVAGVPLTLLIMLILVVVLAVGTRKTASGFRLYAAGASDQVSRYAGFNVFKIRVATFVISGTLASLSGVMTLSRVGSITVGAGTSYLILAILIAVLAGISPYGGTGRLIAVPIAVVITQQLSTGTNMVFAGSTGATFIREFTWGALLILVLGLSQEKTKRRFRQLLRQRSRPSNPTVESESVHTRSDLKVKDDRGDR